MRKLLFILAASMMGCVSATVTEPSICESQALSLPSVPLSVPGADPTISTTQQMDLSGTFSKIKDVTDSVSIAVNQLVVDNSSGNMSWLNHVEVDIASQGMPSKVMVNYDLKPSDQNSSSVNLPVVLDNDTLYSYLSKGPVTLTFTLSGNIPTQAVNLSGMMCLSASASVSKSL